MKISAAAQELYRDCSGELGHKPTLEEMHHWCDTYKVLMRHRSELIHLVIHA